MRINQLEIESPLMNAGGVVKTADDAEIMAATGVGAVLAGSYTLEPRAGNSPNGERVYYFGSETQITYNALGMPNKGIEAVCDELPAMIDAAHRNRKPFVLNIAPVSDDPAQEVEDMLLTVLNKNVKGIDAVELNAGCPNVVTDDGGRHELLSHHPDLMGDVLSTMNRLRRSERLGDLWVCVSPAQDLDHLLALPRLAVQHSVDAVRAFNTFPGGRPTQDEVPILEVPGGIGGMSGPGMRPRAEYHTMVLDAARAAERADFEIVGSNGVYDADSMNRRMNLGASMVAATTLFYESTDWKRTVDTMLQDYAHNFS